MIVLSSVVLVVVTMVAVACAARRRWAWTGAPAWVLGAVLAPTDAAAVAGLAKRHAPANADDAARGESDQRRHGAGAVRGGVGDRDRRGVGGTGRDRPGSFVGSYAGGIAAAGSPAAWLVVLVRRRLDDPLREGALSVLTPFLAFLLAELVHASGVVAVVVAGLVLTHASGRASSAPGPGFRPSRSGTWPPS